MIQYGDRWIITPSPFRHVLPHVIMQFDLHTKHAVMVILSMTPVDFIGLPNLSLSQTC